MDNGWGVHTFRLCVSQQTSDELLQHHTVLLKVLCCHGDGNFKGGAYLLGGEDDREIRGVCAVVEVMSVTWATHCDVCVLCGLSSLLQDLTTHSGGFASALLKPETSLNQISFKVNEYTSSPLNTVCCLFFTPVCLQVSAAVFFRCVNAGVLWEDWTPGCATSPDTSEGCSRHSRWNCWGEK